ncbi:MAG: hypothetical protein HQL64_06620 [Magnetococcales bacterium]|nr:hypothetical protein [Magnetococcales bacterium]
MIKSKSIPVMLMVAGLIGGMTLGGCASKQPEAQVTDLQKAEQERMAAEKARQSAKEDLARAEEARRSAEQARQEAVAAEERARLAKEKAVGSHNKNLRKGKGMKSTKKHVRKAKAKAKAKATAPK